MLSTFAIFALLGFLDLDKAKGRKRKEGENTKVPLVQKKHGHSKLARDPLIIW